MLGRLGRFSRVVSVHDERDGDSDDAHSDTSPGEQRPANSRVSAGVLTAQEMRSVHAESRSVSLYFGIECLGHLGHPTFSPNQ